MQGLCVTECNNYIKFNAVVNVDLYQVQTMPMLR